MEVDVPIVSEKKCRAVMELLDVEDTDSMICAGDIAEARACHRDSGGPLVVQGRDGAWSLTGIVSWGRGYYCDLYSVFTRVTSYESWIRETPPWRLPGRPRPNTARMVMIWP